MKYWFVPVLSIVLFCRFGNAQTYTQRGFVELRSTEFPQKAPNDRAQFVGEAFLLYEGFYKFSNSFQINGAIDLRTDSHHQVERKLGLSWWDRETQRPLAEVRRLSAVYHRGGLSFEAGKQFIRWGKADILNPTDRFAPRDYLTVVDNDFLGITAARAIYEKGSETLDVVWSPRLTPSRVPLQSQRWFVRPDPLTGILIREGPSKYPGGPQAGFRWNHVGLVEFSGTFYEGFNHLPLFDAVASFQPGFIAVDVNRSYPKLRMVGADAAIPLHLFGVKTETAYFTSSDARAENYVQSVLQLERHTGEWSFVGGYAGEWITRHGSLAGFAPDRGITKTILGSARYTIDTNRSVAFETSIRQNLDGGWAKAEYSEALGQHWRATANVSVIRGKPTDFLGQYRKNSHATVILRYSF